MASMLIRKGIWHSFAKLTYKQFFLSTAYSELSLIKFSPLLVKINGFSTDLQLKTQHEYQVTFIKANGDRIIGKGKEGDTLLDVVVNNNLDFDGFGACEGTVTCSTCHCIFKKEDYDKLPEKPNEDELDMLDLAYDLTDTSRLGCQIKLSKELDGVEVKIPATINDARA
uniref:2Fe-2S ferredoxin-type domain-containing protein n=1 Tax=Graphocephala atropunctata TaxID=36148 RepID=A0A1B6LRF8_9HEMI